MNVQRSLHPQYHDLGALEQGTEPPTAPQLCYSILTAPGVCSRCVCVFTAVCTLDGLNAEHKFRVWVTILGRMSRHFHFQSNYKCKLPCSDTKSCKPLALWIPRGVTSIADKALTSVTHLASLWLQPRLSIHQSYPVRCDWPNTSSM